MPLNQALLPEFDQEMANTRKSLERTPDGKFDWKPHPKSPALGWLANHVANIPGWAVITVERDSIDISKSDPSIVMGKTKAEVLDLFEKNVKEARAAIASATDEQLTQPWTLLAGEKKIFTLPKIAVLRSFVMNHLIHHRAQFGVYLRLNDVPVPAIYGPSADEGGF